MPIEARCSHITLDQLPCADDARFKLEDADFEEGRELFACRRDLLPVLDHATLELHWGAVRVTDVTGP